MGRPALEHCFIHRCLHQELGASFIDRESTQVSAMLRTFGVVSYLSIHCSASKGSILTILKFYVEETKELLPSGTDRFPEVFSYWTLA